MGQTFERVCEAKERNSLMERSKMTADFLWILTLDTKIKDKRYMYLIKPEEDAEADALEGSISGVKRQLTKLDKKMTDNFETQRNKICTEVADHQVSALNALQEKTNEMEVKIKKMSKSFNTMETKMDSKFSEIIGLLSKKWNLLKLDGS